MIASGPESMLNVSRIGTICGLYLSVQGRLALHSHSKATNQACAEGPSDQPAKRYLQLLNATVVAHRRGHELVGLTLFRWQHHFWQLEEKLHTAARCSAWLLGSAEADAATDQP